jgi:hypothetical protein
VRSWWPAAGAPAEPGPPELGVVVAGFARGEAVALGRELGQLAIFELTDHEQLVVPCDGSAPGGRDRWWPGAEWDGPEPGSADGEWLTAGAVAPWWDEHARALRAHGVGVSPAVRCPSCSSADVAWIAYGMPCGPPPPWDDLAGCCIPPDPPQRRCRHCGHAWGSLA